MTTINIGRASPAPHLQRSTVASLDVAGETDTFARWCPTEHPRSRMPSSAITKRQGSALTAAGADHDPHPVRAKDPFLELRPVAAYSV